MALKRKCSRLNCWKGLNESEFSKLQKKAIMAFGGSKEKIMNKTQVMATLLLMLTVLSLVAPRIQADHNVTISLLDSAIAIGAVCLDGTPPAYAYSPGFGDGYHNWHVYLEVYKDE
ncbi:pectin acetylesterase 11-like [Salvia splendens]|uniref:pectin acetylesterase 11-like n=1 Tax=Salvia splendens TaxID=180675 RepID=UPI001C266F00|nr:pectin acetylesterase 11-like [Salvia splendens]